jgi:Fe2+ transport system protein FeoA
MKYLSMHGMVPGCMATLAERAPDGTLTLEVGTSSIAIGAALARQIYVSNGEGDDDHAGGPRAERSSIG